MNSPGQGPAPDIVLYADAPAPVEVFRRPGDTLTLTALARAHHADPAAPDAGAIVIITRAAGKNSGRQQWLVSDGHVIADPATGRARLLADPGSAVPLTIGRHWHSPLGLTYPVRAVMRPRTSPAPTGQITVRPDAPCSPPHAALAWLEQYVPRPAYSKPPAGPEL